MIKGMVLLIAVAFDLYSKKQGKPSLIGRLMDGAKGSRAAAQPDQNPAEAEVTPTTDTIRTEN